ncbi:nad-dependent epimerase dehydratase [Diaporthe amygdali]|uniref:nad-dependent epimerase dehydratase n=1 Tax=Phomopsis amygdali TaxID=1214568 RepID=UPI0022FE06D1|nr:nad-dependent epimerase dehydratase [Diaporthe amygdali]KAJ0122155.1 nad-dependent epimerase dehydratase [Diaporthe amygdali]
MQILILGATGRTGTQVVLQALERGHNVTALVRTPSALDEITANLPAEQKSNLTAVKGSPLNVSDVTNAINTAASPNSKLVVISALNSRRTSENPWAAPHPTDSPPRMMADSTANVLSVLAKTTAGWAEKPKVVYVSAIGVGKSGPNAHWVLRTLISHSNVKLTYADHDAAEEELRNAGDGVKWVVLRPGRLTDGDDKKEAKVWPAEKGMVGMTASTSRGTVARFALDAAEKSEWDGKDPIILN